jgi:hypothetical protein
VLIEVVIGVTVKPEEAKFEAKAEVPPSHKAEGVAVGVKAVPAITPTLTVPVTVEHPVTFELNVYCVVALGEAVVTAPVVVDKFVLGDQVNAVPPVTFPLNTTFPPAVQINAIGGSVETRGRTV